MARRHVHFMCRECGGVHSRWMGKCPDCGAWDALERYVEPEAPTGSSAPAIARAWADDGSAAAAAPAAVPLADIATGDVARLPTGIAELDRVLGGGFVPGSAVLLGGAPGIGKSTLLLQAAAEIARSGARALYVTSEESAAQTRLRAERLFGPDDGPALGEGLDSLYVLAETSLARVLEQARRIRPAVLLLDSIQTVYQSGVEAAAGSVNQLRRCCADLVQLAKISGMAIVMVGHVTKDGQLAGPRLVEHLVDAVLSFEGDRHHAHRMVRAVKNRFGTTLEVGLFEMTGRGLAEVTDPAAGLDLSAEPVPGSVCCPIVHGTRCLMVEIQALTAPGFPGAAKRRTSGLDANRVAMLIAVLEQIGGLRLADRDVFVSVIGGVRVVEPAADLAICLAIAGAHGRRRLPAGVVVAGEVGLDGAVRHPPRIEERLREAVRRRAAAVLMRPVISVPADAPAQILPAATIVDALGLLSAVVGGAKSGWSPPPEAAGAGRSTIAVTR